MRESALRDATATNAGRMTADQAAKLDSLTPGGGYITSVAPPFSVTSGELNASAASSASAGLMTGAQVDQLDAATAAASAAQATADAAQVDATQALADAATAQSTATAAASAAGAAQTTANAAIPNADATTITGAKTFSAIITATLGLISSFVRAVGVSLSLYSNLGASAATCVVIGTSETSTNTSASTKLAVFATDASGTPTESLAVLKNGVLQGGSAALVLNNTVGGRLSYGSGYVTVTNAIDIGGATVRLLANNAIASGAYGIQLGLDGPDSSADANGKIVNIGTTSGDKFNVYKDRTVSYGAHYFQRSIVDLGASGFPSQWISTGAVGFQIDTTGSIGSTAALLSLRMFGDNMIRFTGAGRIDQFGSDSSGSPGNATINRPIGKSAIAVGASSVVITNNLVTAGMHCIITPHARDATCKELIAVCTANTITVSGSANATAAVPFSWVVRGML